MIQETQSRRRNAAITSDQWHVVRARWSGEIDAAPRFDRSVVSEHADRESAVESARTLMTGLRGEQAHLPPQNRDQVFVRGPGYKSLKTAGRRVRRRK